MESYVDTMLWIKLDGLWVRVGIFETNELADRVLVIVNDDPLLVTLCNVDGTSLANCSGLYELLRSINETKKRMPYPNTRPNCATTSASRTDGWKSPLTMPSPF